MAPTEFPCSKHRAPFAHSPLLHVHHNEDEIFHVLSGELRCRVDGRDIPLRAGETLLAERSVPHTFVVESEGGATFLTMTARGDFERLVRAMGRPAERDVLPVVPPPTPNRSARLRPPAAPTASMCSARRCTDAGTAESGRRRSFERRRCRAERLRYNAI